MTNVMKAHPDVVNRQSTSRISLVALGPCCRRARVKYRHSQQVETLSENDRTRFPITPQVSKDILTRFLQLNHQRAAEEQTKLPPTKETNQKKVQKLKSADELI